MTSEANNLSEASKFMTVELDRVNYTGEALRHLAIAGYSIPAQEVNNQINITNVSALIQQGMDIAAHNSGPGATGITTRSHQVRLPS